MLRYIVAAKRGVYMDRQSQFTQTWLYSEDTKSKFRNE